ncbi:TetR/AcrR family transcriptional regulator [Sphingosinicella rhizophila]|uniref:TetR/AcrR family transcriptional regulator n=1 Tax=Sphingosinicella rhizophila TaxID=3050082 RepID=A0ABU3QBG1_9SPHN|nr:TetR/AcrR family transcriptional regulator [Sphingosinicella sp. GR2756]MDT9600617.1 TetR/AcrR family transcriptional regulator [Sphingosinicella sp. GR2756]
MPKRPDDYMEDRRDRILDAVELCCREKGWNQTTLRDVAAVAGLSKGGLYVHFATKTQLLEEILRRNVERIESLGKPTDPEAFIAYLQQNVLHVAGPEGREGAIAQGELQLDGVRNPDLRPLVEAVARKAVSVLEGVVRKFRPGLEPEEVTDRALAILFLLEGLRNYVGMSGNASVEQLQRVLARQVRAILHGRP